WWLMAVDTDSAPRAAGSEETKNPDLQVRSLEPVKGREWSRRLNPLRWQSIPPVPEQRSVSKEYGAGFFSIISFQWMSSLMNVGYLRPLELQDIWTVNPNRAVDVLLERLEAALARRTERGSKNPLIAALYDTFRFEFLLGAGCQLFGSLLLVFAPYLTRYLIAFATEAYEAKKLGHGTPDLGRGMGFVVGITVMQSLQSICTNQFLYRGQMVGAQIRAVLISLIFKKAMRLSGRAKAGGKATSEELLALQAAKDEAMSRKSGEKKDGEEDDAKGGPDAANGIAGDGRGWSNGRIIALMSIDVDRINLACGMFHMLWSAPLSIIVTLVLLLVNLGVSSLAGYALLLLSMPALTIAVRALVKRRSAINKLTDARVSLTQEILQAVRFVKFFGWEQSFLNRLKDLRNQEIRAIQRVLAIKNAIMCVSISIPIFASMLAFITYSLTNHALVAANVFSSLALFNSMRGPLNSLPMVIGQVADAFTAQTRISEFLAAEEQVEGIETIQDMENAIEVEDASFTWERLPIKEEDGPGDKKPAKALELKKPKADEDAPKAPFKLEGINLEVGRNELVAVIGTVGCGKSSLLSALAGDMRLTQGKVRMGTTRAFCPQYAWIQNASLRNNIVFGKEFDEAWYNDVVEACALLPDLEVLPYGDQTEIGERGITVSGGQKQRLNIARAIYFNAELVLMDDPLSAVDAHVGRHIMDKAICGLLKGRCRILATHQLHVLSRCDRIIVMDAGKVHAFDTFDNLLRDNELFQRLMSSSKQEESEEDAEEQDEIDIEKDAVEPANEEEAKPAEPTAGKAPNVLMQQEDKATASVGWEIWRAYILASGSYFNAFAVIFLLCVANVANMWCSLWLSYWSSRKYPALTQNDYIGIYASLGASVVIFMFLFSTYMTTAGTKASKTMLHRAMTRVLRAPMTFFDTTPLGRITNRFSRDVQVMDSELSDAMRIYSLTITMVLSVLILIIVFFYYFVIALVPLVILFLLAANYYRASAREIKRHESVLRSVVYSRFGEAIAGVSSIRAYGVQDQFGRSIREAIDTMDVSTLLVFVVGVLVVTSRFNVSPSISGLVLSYILAIAQMLQFTVRQLAEVENNMNATERLHYYGTQLDEEAPLHLGEVPDSWPEKGRIQFVDVKMRYRDGLPLVLKGLSMDIQGGERIGIVGRTGAGKSSIMSALFRLTELSGGNIQIDGVDIAKIGLSDLRSRLAIIPQDPALFKGTIRTNLDPFEEHTDLELWSALRKAYLIGDDTLGPDTEGIQSLPPTGTTTPTEEVDEKARSSKRLTLESAVDEEGLNFSLGQRQLMALARALVRDARIIVCDEATSSVDFETDQKIQYTMARGFEGKTLLCIAHRLRTIIGYDRICVMDQGQIAEMDTPLALWDRPDSIFRTMCDRSGISRQDILDTL
ncbi:ABC transporter integral membrane type 1, partial [Penicillium chermesinum]